MNLVERLLKVDAGEIKRERTKEIASKRLVSLLGEDAKVTIKEVDPEEYTNLSTLSLDGDGNVDYGKAFNTNAHIATAGIVSPNLKDPELMKHLGAMSPKEAAVILFKGEINKIAAEVSELSGFANEEEQVEEVKN